MNQITNRQAVCEVLLQEAAQNHDILVACSDSSGSASLVPFKKTFPKQFIEVGIAEQNLVSVSAGLALCGKTVIAASPASFLSTRAYEQAKVDVAYSGANVLLLGISGGVSYGALGMSHHSLQDIAAFTALVDMKVYLPSDRFQTAFLTRQLLKKNLPAYVRVSRSATQDVYDENTTFTLDKAQSIGEGSDVTIIACGEMVPYAVAAAALLRDEGYSAGVLDMYCLKPFDEEAVLACARRSKLLVSVEEHSLYGGLGSLVSQTLTSRYPKRLLTLALPDEHLVSGTNKEVFGHYRMDAKGIAEQAKTTLTSMC